MAKKIDNMQQKIEYVIKNWEHTTAVKLAEAINVSIPTIYLWVNKARRLGIKLSRKRKSSQADWDVIAKKYGRSKKT